MIGSVLVLPSPRVLLPGLSEIDPVPELRSACTAGVAELLAAGPRRVVVVAAAVGDLNRARGVTEPLGHRVARHLLGGARFEAQVAPPATTASVLEAASGGPTALVVMADGSASRGEKAPGHLHPQAVAFDDAVEHGLRTGDPEVLAGLDADLAHEVWCEGVPGFHLLAEVARGREVTPEVSYAGAPYGVAWWVARWDLA